MTTSTTLTPPTGAAAVPTASERGSRDRASWSDATIAALADRLAVDGPAAHADALRSLASWACDRDVAPSLLTVLTDPAAPEVARLRAFARIAVAAA